MTIIGDRLKKARKKSRLTQKQAAAKLGIDDTTISKYENGKSEPDLQTIERLATLYNTPMEYFIIPSSSEPLMEEIDLSDLSALERMRMYYKGMELTPEEKRRFLEIVRLVFGGNQDH